MNEAINKKWTTAPISPTCDVRLGERCGKPTCYAYPAMGGGWMPLCHEHGQKHLPYATDLPTLILRGETLDD